MRNSNYSKVAAVVALAMAGAGAQAGVVAPAVAASTHSVQFSAREGAVATAGTAAERSVAVSDFAYTTGTALQSGDVITVTITGAEFGQTTASTAGADGYGTLTGTVGGVAATQVTATTGGATSRTYTLQGAVTSGAALTLSGVTLKNSSLGSTGNVQVSVSVARGAVTVDTAAAATVATKVNEFAVAIATGSRWNGVVDMIGGTGKTFTSVADAVAAGAATATTLRDTLTVSITDTDVTGAGDATLQTGDALRLTLGGDFSFLNNTVSGVADGVNFPGTPNGDQITITTNAGAAIGTIVSASATEIVIGFTAAEVNTINGLGVSGGNAGSTILVSLVTDGSATANVKKAQTFTASAVWNYTTTNSAVVQTYNNPALTPGAHTINGVDIFVPYMPAGANISQVLRLVNNSDSAGTAQISARNQAGVACSTAQFGTTQVPARSVVDLGAAFAQGLLACYGSGSNQLFLTVRANIPDTGVELWSSYNVNNDRIAVVNSSNGRKAAELACTTVTAAAPAAGPAAGVDVCSSITNTGAAGLGAGNGTR